MVYLACARIKLNGSTCFFFLQNKLTETLFSSAGKAIAVEFKIFVLSTLEKHQNFSRRGPWSATYDPRELTFLLMSS